ncbi:hypothetical protein KS4_28790 [Poriferisphaera corsica]|uniref:Uncharacterized protein n=1 Tax=Poriferisphaera corsica TaxID=2528020 RepID=A0A517YX58_9BACT|nr:hypothetical protein KS4_28790 [Poriferisphaera corsica]
MTAALLVAPWRIEKIFNASVENRSDRYLIRVRAFLISAALV